MKNGIEAVFLSVALGFHCLAALGGVAIFASALSEKYDLKAMYNKAFKKNTVAVSSSSSSSSAAKAGELRLVISNEVGQVYAVDMGLVEFQSALVEKSNVPARPESPAIKKHQQVAVAASPAR